MAENAPAEPCCLEGLARAHLLVVEGQTDARFRFLRLSIHTWGFLFSPFRFPQYLGVGYSLPLSTQVEINPAGTGLWLWIVELHGSAYLLFDPAGSKRKDLIGTVSFIIELQ